MNNMNQYASWKKGNLRWYIRIKSGDFLEKDNINENCAVPVIGGNGIMGYTSTSNQQENTIVIGRVGALCGNVHFVQEPCWVTDNALVLFRISPEINKRYLSIYLQSLNLNENANKTAQPLITGETVKSKKIVFPPINQQILIVSFLDRKTIQIDTLIADKEKLIELLKEQRQSIISDTVIKGLDKTVLMKDSGVEWIGEIPAHWEIKRMKYVFEIVKRLYYKEDRNVLSVTKKGLKIRDVDSNDGQLAQSYAGYQIVNVNDFAMNSMDLLTGFVDCSVFEGVTSPDYRVFRFIPGKKLNHAYYKHLFQMCYTDKIFYGFGQGVSNLGRWRLQTEVFKNFCIPVPPLSEQKNIAEYIANQSKCIDETVGEIQLQIDLLKEYRQSIISEAVTGKIKITEGGQS